MNRQFNFLSLTGMDKTKPLYQQIAQTVIDAVNNQLLFPGDALPGTRQLAKQLSVHRQTVIEAYELLISKAVCKAIEGKGTFIASGQEEPKPTIAKHSSFSSNFYPMHQSDQFQTQQHWKIRFDDGQPDPDLAPVLPLTKAYKRIYYQKMRQRRSDISYGSAEHQQALKALSLVLRYNRGLTINMDHFCTIIGNQLALYLVTQTLIKPGDYVAIESPANAHTWAALERANARLIPIMVDGQGIDTKQLKQECHEKKIKAVYVTPQGQYPTTATLSEERRVELLQLAKEHAFAIIESDFDHEFSFKDDYTPPLIKRDMDGSVIYLSCLSRMMAPMSLISFVIGPAEFMRSLKGLWSALDYQGDAVLEQALIELIREGTLLKYMRKSSHAYKAKNESAAYVIDEYLGRHAAYIKPYAGLAYWIEFKKQVNIPAMQQELQKQSIYIPNTEISVRHSKPINGLRLGFASLDAEKWITGIKAIAASLFFMI